jgi:hypothetical protein
VIVGYELQRVGNARDEIFLFDGGHVRVPLLPVASLEV